MKKLIILIILNCILFSLNAQTYTGYTPTNSGLSNNQILCITIDKFGNKWIGIDSAIMKFDGINWTKWVINTFPSVIRHTYCIAIDNQNNKWIGTGYGLFKYDNVNFTHYTTSNSGLTNNVVLSVAVDSNSHIWIGTQHGLNKFDGTNWVTVEDSIVFTSIAVEPTGNHAVWVTTGLNMKVFRYLNNIKTEYNTANTGIIDFKGEVIAIDKYNHVWLGSRNRGLIQFTGEQWISYYNSSNPGLSSNAIYSQNIAFDEFNNKWIGGVGTLSNPNTTLLKFNNLSFNYYIGFSPPGTITSVAVDSVGNKWIAVNSQGIWKMDCEQPVVTAINGAALVGLGQQGLVYRVPNNHDALYYHWNLPAGFTGSSTGDSIVVNISPNAVSGIISVYGHSSCGDGLPVQLSVTVANGIGINENSKLSDISVYPNPVANELYITNKGSELITYEIYNTLGAGVCKGIFNNECVVNTSNFSRGIYYLILNNGKDFNVQKIVKE